MPGDFDLLVVDQDLDKDRHIWGKVFGNTVTASIQKLSVLEVIRHVKWLPTWVEGGQFHGGFGFLASVPRQWRFAVRCPCHFYSVTFPFDICCFEAHKQQAI